MNSAWYVITNEATLPSPALLVYPDRIEHNIREMIRIAGGTARLRPHVKTHKSADILQLQLKFGITKFKCATLNEARMVLEAGGKDVLIAYPLYGPALANFLALQAEHSSARLMLTTDHKDHVIALENHAAEKGAKINVYLDMNAGMGRTGVGFDSEGKDLLQAIRNCEHLQFVGLHIYDGHIHQSDRNKRMGETRSYLADLHAFREGGMSPEERLQPIVCGGTPTFGILAEATSYDLSPGTPLLWDQGYSRAFPEFDFLQAAVLLTRIVHINDQQLTLDLGYKSVASEMPHPRAYFPAIPTYEAIGHSEEHLMIAAGARHSFRSGQCIYAIPHHICPTVALYDELQVIRDGAAREKWPVTARSKTY